MNIVFPSRLRRLFRRSKTAAACWRGYARSKAARRAVERQLDEGEPCDLVVYLTPGADKITGGIISIVSLCKETQALRDADGSVSVLCTLPDEPRLAMYSAVEDPHVVLPLERVLRGRRPVRSLVLNVPANRSETVIDSCGEALWESMASIPFFHVNVLLQNIDNAPGRAAVQRLIATADRVTATTAHERYCTPEVRESLGIPLHRLSVWISPEQYRFVDYADKEDLMLVSPDPHPERDTVMAAIARACPHIRMEVVRNLSYREYKELAAKAKWSLTFGEGLDGYFIEPVFSGAVACAVYNDRFFTPEFSEHPSVFESYQQMVDGIGEFLSAYDEAEKFQELQQRIYDQCEAQYSGQRYRHNLNLFFEGRYTFP